MSSGQSIAFPNICLNVAVADSLDLRRDELEKATAGGQSLDEAVGKLLTKMVKETKPIIFNGNDYSAEWEKEAAKRKLLNLKNTVDALPELVKPEVIAVFEKHKVLNEREMKARYEIILEQYIKTINVEAQLMVLMANRYILPAARELPDGGGAERGGRQGGGRRRRRETQEAADRLHQDDRRLPQGDRQARHGARARRRLDREAREVHARHHRPADGRAARARRQASRRRCRRTRGRCRPTARCCSSSSAVVRIGLDGESRLRPALAAYGRRYLCQLRARYGSPARPLSACDDLHRERHHRPRRARARPQAAGHVHRRRRHRRPAPSRLGDPRQRHRRGDERLRRRRSSSRCTRTARRSPSPTTAAASRWTSTRRPARARSR